MEIKHKVRQAVERKCKKLKRDAKQLGYVRENFGQKEVRALQDEFFGLCYGDHEERAAYSLVIAFEEWCWGYTGKD